MRISDWSSDVCASDLARRGGARKRKADLAPRRDGKVGDDAVGKLPRGTRPARRQIEQAQARDAIFVEDVDEEASGRVDAEILDAPVCFRRSEERRVGHEWVRTCRYRWTQVH